MICEPFNAVVDDENALRFDRAAVNSQRPVTGFTEPFAGSVGSPEVALVSVPDVFTPIPARVTAPRPNPTSAAVILFAVVAVLETVAIIERTYAALLRSLSGTSASTKLFVFDGPSSPRFMTTASGLLTVPSVVTPPPELPVSVTAPPELISTNFETVPLI